LKDDVDFALLTTIYPHTVAMFNELNNLLGLDELNNLLGSEAHWIKIHANQQHGSIIGESNNRGGNRS
jgi:hypothetical protein